ncbi:MAG: hypothetical protein JOZ75_07390 [Candidatus Dormibacteraeota bacterium]|nr:hypothetical protein [Candidatus Dormibacteraeota bacterium]
MGEAATDTRREIEEKRDELTGTLHELRVRGRRARHVGVRVVVIAAGVSAVAGVSVASVIIVRRRDSGPLTRGSKRLPSPARKMAVPTARSADRWLGRRGKGLRRGRDELMDEIALRVAQQYAAIERRSNPWWRRALSTGAEAGATAAAGALVQALLRRSKPAHRDNADDDANGAYRGSSSGVAG